MESYDLYVFILCLIVFLLLTAIFTFFIVSMGNMEISLIRYGHRDKEIKKEFNKNESLRKELFEMYIRSLMQGKHKTFSNQLDNATSSGVVAIV